MKKLVLWVPDDMHRRLVARAGRSDQSLNAVALFILDAGLEGDQDDALARIRSRARALGLLQEAPAPPRVAREARKAAVASTAGLGPFVDGYLQADGARQ